MWEIGETARILSLASDGGATWWNGGFDVRSARMTCHTKSHGFLVGHRLSYQWGWKHFFDGDSSELIVSPKKCIMSLDCNQFETPGSSGMGQQWTPLVTGRHMYGATLFKQCLYLSVNLEMGDFQATCLIHILVFNWNIIACSSENCRHFFLWLLSEQTSSTEQSLKPKPTSKNCKYELKNNRNKTRLAS